MNSHTPPKSPEKLHDFSHYEAHILIIDDEASIRGFLNAALNDRYRVTTCGSGYEALSLLDTHRFDVVVTDLKLPDSSGIDILKKAKERDEFVEVIIITGYASLDTATEATNQGASLYLIKPVTIDVFLPHIERVMANRLFHLKSLALMQDIDRLSPEIQEHFAEVTSLYNFSRKLLVSFEVPEIIEIILSDVNQRMGSLFCALGINFLDFAEVYVMPGSGRMPSAEAREYLVSHWEETFPFFDKQQLIDSIIPVTTFPGKRGETPEIPDGVPVTVPMLVQGRNIGSLCLFHGRESEKSNPLQDFLYVYTSLISAIIEHAYIDMQAQLQAKTDSLTGVANHRHFHENLSREIARSRRSGNGFALILIDIDDFKKINDSFGHLVGDTVLRDLTSRIQSTIRAGDILARYGGEEFALILPDTDREGGEILANRVREEIASRSLALPHARVTYSVSLGVCFFDGTAPIEKNTLIDRADRALYDSKRNGKNRVTVYS